MKPTRRGIDSASIGLGFVLLVILLAVFGCSRSDRRVTAPAPEAVAPTPDSPVNAVRLLGWCWDHRRIADYRTVLADDYRCVPAVFDTFAGQPIDRDLTRDLELTAAENLFARGTAQLPPATRITLDFDPNLVALPDSRPGKDEAAHREIHTCGPWPAALRRLSAAGPRLVSRLLTMNLRGLRLSWGSIRRVARAMADVIRRPEAAASG